MWTDSPLEEARVTRTRELNLSQAWSYQKANSMSAMAAVAVQVRGGYYHVQQKKQASLMIKSCAWVQDEWIGSNSSNCHSSFSWNGRGWLRCPSSCTRPVRGKALKAGKNMVLKKVFIV